MKKLSKNKKTPKRKGRDPKGRFIKGMIAPNKGKKITSKKTLKKMSKTWFQKGQTPPNKGNYRSFTLARGYIRKLKLKNVEEWKKHTKSRKFPKDLPKWPPASYEKVWPNWADFLGTDNKKGGWLEFSKARAWARNSGIESGAEWRIAYKNNKIPKNIPANPDSVYKRAGMWKGWADFLGTRNQKGGWMSFTDARKHVRKLKFQKKSQYLAYVKSGKASTLLPAYPDSAYKNKGWKGWPDFLGTDYVPPQLRQYRSFEKARKFARSLKLKTFVGWRDYVKSGKIPKDISGTPHRTYKSKGWIDYQDWLGTDTISPQAKHRALPPFSVARRWARDTGIETFDEWKEVTKLGWMPFEIPVNPADAYEEWKSWSDFLGTGKHVKGESYRSFKDARKFARSLKLESGTAWTKHWKTHRIPHDIPLNPDQRYRGKGWKSWSDFLGNRSKQGGWWSYERARRYMISLHLKSRVGFMKLRDEGKLPDDIPLEPVAAYKNKGWKGWGHFLGTGNLSPSEISQNYLPLKEGLALIRKLGKKHNLKNTRDWRRFAKKNKKLLEKLKLPTSPVSAYSIESVWRKMKK